MAISRWNRANLMNTDALFRAIAQIVSTAFIAAGLVKVTEAGEINFATATLPATGTIGGFEIFRFSDTLQGTRPVYIRVNHGRGTGANYAMQIQAGTGTNGSGTLTGLVGSLFSGFGVGAAADAAVSLPSFINGSQNNTDGGWFTVGLYPVFQTAAIVTSFSGFSFSRTRNAAGAQNGDGLNQIKIEHGSMQSRYMDFLLGNNLPTTGVITGLTAVVPNTTLPDYNFLGEPPVFPAQPARPFLDYPDLGVALCSPTAVAAGQIFKTELLGAIHSYFCIGSGFSTTNPLTSANSTLAVGLRYE